jgi:Tol biopolymer transport system component
MTAQDRFDSGLHDLLADLGDPHDPPYLDDVLARAVARPQRPAWTFPERWLPMGVLALRPTVVAPRWRPVALLLLLGLLLAAIFALAVGTRRTPPPYGLASNGVVAYSAEGDILLRDMTRGSDRVAVGGPGDDVAPFYSLDGSRLAFYRIDAAASTETLVVANADGTGVRELVTAGVVSAEWAPASDELAVVTETDGERRLSILSMDGGRRDLGLDFEPVSVRWRPPDGRELIVLGSPVSSGFAIYAVNAAGYGARQLLSPRAENYYLDFQLSPDGGTMAYTTYPGQEAVQIRLLELATGTDRRFGAALPPLDSATPLNEGFPTFSPDGTRLAFGRYWDETSDAINHQIWVASIASDGADGFAASPLQRSEPGHNPYLATFSPDGKSLLVWADVERAWLTNLDDRTPQSLPLAPNDLPTWQRGAP